MLEDDNPLLPKYQNAISSLRDELAQGAHTRTLWWKEGSVRERKQADEYVSKHFPHWPTALTPAVQRACEVLRGMSAEVHGCLRGCD